VDGRLRHRRAGAIDRRGKDANQAAQADRRQVTPSDHGADGLLVATEPARSVGDREEKRAQGE